MVIAVLVAYKSVVTVTCCRDFFGGDSTSQIFSLQKKNWLIIKATAELHHLVFDMIDPATKKEHLEGNKKKVVALSQGHPK